VQNTIVAAVAESVAICFRAADADAVGGPDWASAVDRTSTVAGLSSSSVDAAAAAAEDTADADVVDKASAAALLRCCQRQRQWGLDAVARAHLLVQPSHNTPACINANGHQRHT